MLKEDYSRPSCAFCMIQPQMPSQMPPQILRRLILDQAIAGIECSEDERQQLQRQFDPDSARQQLRQEEVSDSDLADWLEREVRTRKFQRQQWGKMLTSYFLQRKDQLDQVICSLIYLTDLACAQELYFRIVEGEQSFAELARLYSQQPHSPEPIALGDLPPQLARMFYGARAGQVWLPTAISPWIVIARLEAHLPVQLDDNMRQMLYNERREQWLNGQLKRQFG